MLPPRLNSGIREDKKSFLRRIVWQITMIPPVNRIEDPAPLGLPEQAQVKVCEWLVKIVGEEDVACIGGQIILSITRIVEADAILMHLTKMQQAAIGQTLQLRNDLLASPVGVKPKPGARELAEVAVICPWNSRIPQHVYQRYRSGDEFLTMI